jgi:hypothetical protein
MRIIALVAILSSLAAPAFAEGDLDHDTIIMVVTKHSGKVKACYQKHLATHPDARGQVVAKWTIRADGSVADVTASGIATSVEQCIVAVIQRVKFPAVPNGESLPFRFSFQFAGQ